MSKNQATERPKVHVSNRGGLYVNAEEVVSSDVGQKV